MKILIICHEFPPVGGGAGNAAMYLAKHLSEKKHKVVVLTSRFKKSNKYKYNFNIIYIPVLRKHIDRTSPLELISFALSGIIYSLLNIRKGDYNFCLAIHGIPSGWVALALYKLFKIPYAVSLRGGDVPGFLPQSYDRLHRKIKGLTDLYWKNAKSLITNSHGLKELSEATANRIKRDVKIIPNGVDSDFFRPDYSLRDNKIIKIIYTGRVTLQKGVGGLIETLRQIYNRTEYSFNLEIIGDGPLKEEIKNTSLDLCDKGILTFTDWLDKESLLMRYKKAHIFILPSLYEGMSNSLLEAMSCGCMIIATDIPGNNELVKEGENGFLFMPGDSLRLIKILTDVLNGKLEVIENMGRKSRTIAERYDWNNVAEEYLEDFKRIAKQSR